MKQCLTIFFVIPQKETLIQTLFFLPVSLRIIFLISYKEYIMSYIMSVKYFTNITKKNKFY